MKSVDAYTGGVLSKRNFVMDATRIRTGWPFQTTMVMLQAEVTQHPSLRVDSDVRKSMCIFDENDNDVNEDFMSEPGGDSGSDTELESGTGEVRRRNRLAKPYFEAPTYSLESLLTQLEGLESVSAESSVTENSWQIQSMHLLDWQYVACRGNVHAAFLLNFFLRQQRRRLQERILQFHRLADTTEECLAEFSTARAIYGERQTRVCHRFSCASLSTQALFNSISSTAVIKHIDWLIEWGFLECYRSGRRLSNGHLDRTPLYVLNTAPVFLWLMRQQRLGNPFEIVTPVTWFVDTVDEYKKPATTAPRVNICIVEKSA